MKYAWWGIVFVAALASADEGERDVMDRPVATLTAGRPVMMIFSNRETRDTTAGPSRQMGVRLHDVPYVTVVHVDLRGVPGFVEGIAHAEMRDAFKSSIERAKQEFAAAKCEPALPYEERLAIVADSYGLIHKAHGLPKGFTESIAVVVDPTGREILQVPYPREIAKVEEVLRRFAPGAGGP